MMERRKRRGVRFTLKRNFELDSGGGGGEWFDFGEFEKNEVQEETMVVVGLRRRWWWW